MNVWVRQRRNGAWSTRRSPTGAQPVVLTMFVFNDVSSMKISRCNALLMKGWRRAIQTRRARATSGRRRSAASRAFFVAETKPVQQPAGRATMHRQPVMRRELHHQFVKRDVSLPGDAPPHPVSDARQLAATPAALLPGGESASLALQPHHIVDELWRHPEVPRRFSMCVAFLDEGNDTFSERNRMRSAHLDPLHLPHSEGITPHSIWESRIRSDATRFR